MTIAIALLRRYWLHALVLAALAWGGYKLHAYVWQNGYNAANVRAEQVIAEFAKAEADAQARARVTERRYLERITDISEQYERDKADAQAAADRLAADLRAGNVRLRNEWAGCETGRVSGDATAARLADEAAQLRAKGASDLVRAAAEADAQVRGLQRVIEAERVR